MRSKRAGMGGFTMIELIVVVAIIALMSGIGLTTFLNLRDRRVVLADARLVEQNLREAQRRALAGEKPAGCGANVLTGYQVRVEQEAIFQLAVCPGGAPVEKRADMAGSVLTSTLGTITFGAVKGGATAAVISVCQEGSGKYLYQVEVNDAGSVEAPAEQPGPC